MSAVSANNTMVSSGKDGSSSTNVASSVTSVSPSILVHSNRSVYGVWEFFNIQVPTFSLASVFSMLIVVTFLILALALMHKHVVKTSWKPSSQQLSEKFRLYMAGSMVGARRMFNGWTMSRQDDVTISNRDEKNRRLSLDMSSSSSISLSPSDPVDDTAPRLHKKASNTRLSSHRRSNLRSKPQILSPIDDNPSTISSNDDQPIDQSTETDESKTTVTINVSDPRSEHVTHQEIDYEIGRVSVNQLHQNFENGSQSNNDNQEIINSRNESFQNSVTNNDNETNSHIPFDTSLNTSLDTSLKTSLVPSLIPTTNDISTQLHKKNSKPKLKVQQRSQKDQKDQTVFFTTQESEGEVESSSSIPSTPKNVQDSTQEENFVKPGNRRRRRKPKNSKNNSQQNFQQQNSQQENNNHSEQRSSLQKHDNIQQNINGLSRSRQSDEMLYNNNNNNHSQQPRKLMKTDDYNIWQKSLHTEPTQYQTQTQSQTPQSQTQSHHSQQRPDYYMQGNKRNDVVFQSTNSGTTVPAKVTLPDINKKTTVFPRRNSQSNNSNNSSMNRFISYAGAISSQNRPPPITTKISNEIPSTLPTLPTLPALSALSADSNIKAPVPAAASVRNSTNHQWYSPFGSGLSIQFNPPVPPEDIHNKWASNNSASLFSSPMIAPNYHGTSTTPSSPISPTSNETTTTSSSISMFSSSPFSTLTNHDRRNSIQTRPLTNFGKIHDQEKGELLTERADEMIRERSFKSKILNHKDKLNEGLINMDQGQNVPQFSLFDKQLSFRMYPSKS